MTKTAKRLPKLRNSGNKLVMATVAITTKTMAMATAQVAVDMATAPVK